MTGETAVRNASDAARALKRVANAGPRPGTAWTSAADWRRVVWFGYVADLRRQVELALEAAETIIGQLDAEEVLNG